MTIVKQLLLILLTEVLMFLSLRAGWGAGMFVIAYAGGYVVSRYDDGHTIRKRQERARQALDGIGGQ